jgi:hypothetical protein
VGKLVRVFYDGANPTDAVIEPGLSTSTLIMTWMAGGLELGVLFFFLTSLRWSWQLKRELESSNEYGETLRGERTPRKRGTTNPHTKL